MGFRSFVIAGAVLTWAGLWAVPGAVLAAGPPAPDLSAPEVSLIDDNQVDLSSRNVRLVIPTVKIGNGNLKLAHQIAPSLEPIFGQRNGTFQGRVAAEVDENGSDVYSVVFGSRSESFFAASMNPTKPSGSRLIKGPINSSGQTFIYIDSLGLKYNTDGFGFFKKIVYPDGRIITINSKVFDVSTCNPACLTNGYVTSGQMNLIYSVSSNFGLQLKFSYSSNQFAPNQPTTITAINNAVEYCSTGDQICITSNNWPKALVDWPLLGSFEPFSLKTYACDKYNTYSLSIFVTDMNGEQYKVNTDAIGRISSYRAPNRLNNNYSYEYITSCISTVILGDSYISKVSNENGSWVYSYVKTGEGNSTLVSYSSINPLGLTRASGGNLNGLVEDLNIDGVLVKYSDYGSGQISTIKNPNGGTIAYTYDARGNITQTVETPIPSSGQSPRTVTAGYDTVCTYPAKCNQPNWIKDAQGNQTDFTYNNTTGQVLKVTGPAAPSGIRPQVRNTYTNRFAWFKNASGAFVKASSAISLLTKTSTCKTGAPATTGTGCAVAGDEIITTYEYGPDKGPNNLWLRGVVVDSGGLVLRTCYAYDAVGNRISQTSPRANLGSCP
jgi:YD repeat-containing protein